MIAPPCFRTANNVLASLLYSTSGSWRCFQNRGHGSRLESSTLAPAQLCPWLAWFSGKPCNVLTSACSHSGCRLGDRHGENILFEEGNGGTFHVDFNCLFDKVRGCDSSTQQYGTNGYKGLDF